MKAYRLFNAALAIVVLCLLAMPVAAQLTTPTGVFGYVKMDGSLVGGATVTLSDGQSATTDDSGYYNFVGSVNNGSKYSITASYNGQSTSTTFMAHGDRMQMDLSISTPTPARTGGTIAYAGQPTPDPNVVLIANETSNNTSVNDHPITGEPPTQDQSLTGAGSSGNDVQTSGGGEHRVEEASLNESGNLNLFQLVAGLAILGALAGIGYYLLLRER